jgi:hypothetical protein
MATATKKVDASTPVARGVRGVLESASLELLVHWDNGGDDHWEIVDASDESLVQSDSFGSQRDAECAAPCVYEHASLARLESHIAVGRERRAA